MYKSKLDVFTTQIAIKEIKDFFEKEFAKSLNLIRVSAPIFVEANNGINDRLTGDVRPVIFDTKAGFELEIVQSLAKWKRMALGKYDFKLNTGLYTDMNAIRRDEDLDNIHSYYIDQWDWEIVIDKNNRNKINLIQTVEKIYKTLIKTELMICQKYTTISRKLPNNIMFIRSIELANMYPDLNPIDRENEICKKYGAVFIMEIGHKMPLYGKHGDRAHDYDDWNLNGDILVWSDVLQQAIELSSMGIRVNQESLLKQMELSNKIDEQYEYHKMVLNEELPLTIGGGLGQSRICMFLLEKLHIAEVQASIWDDKTYKYIEENNIQAL